MAGRIREEDIAEVREKARIDEVVSGYVTLRNAGGGSHEGAVPLPRREVPVVPRHARRASSGTAWPARRASSLETAPARSASWPVAVHSVLGASGHWVEAPFKSYGVQPLLKHHRDPEPAAQGTLRDRRPPLVHPVREGSQVQARGADSRLSSVATGLVSKFPRSLIRRTTPSPFGIAHGFTFGDGTRSGTGSLAQLCPPKDLAMLKWFPNSFTTQSGENLLVHHLPRFFKDLPPRDESVSYLYGWLAGYFAADGCVAADGTVILNSADRADLEFVRDICTRLGIGTYGITTQLREGFPGREPSEIHRVHFVNEDLTESFFLLDESPRALRICEQEVCSSGLGRASPSRRPIAWKRSSAPR